MLFVVIRGAFLLILHFILNYIIFEILLDKLQQIVACLFLYIERLTIIKIKNDEISDNKIFENRRFNCEIK